MSGNPFDLSDPHSYAAWRERKLAAVPGRVEELVVEIDDIAALRPAERAALLERVGRCNMAVYAERPKPPRDDKAALRALAQSLGLRRLDANLLADDDGITPLAVHRDGPRSRYIPYSERPIAWHTDGYYNAAERMVRALLLHCASPAAEGGANRVADPELLYILLRDEDPGHVAALMRPDAMTIPGNDEDGFHRPDTAGPVLVVQPGPVLVMRYTARARNVAWSPRPEVAAAAAAIRRLLDAAGGPVFEHRLSAHQGLVCNNVLHTREPFRDDPARPRLLYRARYHDRIG